MGRVLVSGCALHDGSGGLGPAALTRVAAREALRDAELEARRLTAVFIGTGDDNSGEGLTAVGARLGLRSLGKGRDAVAGTILNEPAEHFAASGAEALHMACHAIRLEADTAVLCIGLDVAPAPRFPDKRVVRRRAMEARRVLHRLGASQDDLAAIVVKNHRHGADRGVAQTITIDEVLASEPLDWPFTRSMLAVRGKGAAALVLTSAGAGRGPAVLASTVAGGGGEGVRSAAARAYHEAGLGPEDLDCAEVHDVTAATELDAYDHLGWVAGGSASELVTSGFTALGGVLPVNSSGGLLCLGERPGSAAVAQVASLSLQLRAQIGSGQVRGARTALAQSVGRGGRPGGHLASLTVLAR